MKHAVQIQLEKKDYKRLQEVAKATVRSATNLATMLVLEGVKELETDFNVQVKK